MDMSYVYGIVFSNGSAKIGMSMTLEGVAMRFKAHKRDAKKFGLTAVFDTQLAVETWCVLLSEGDVAHECQLALGLNSNRQFREWFVFDSVDEAVEVLKWVFSVVAKKKYLNCGDKSQEAFMARVAPRRKLNALEASKAKPSPIEQ